MVILIKKHLKVLIPLIICVVISSLFVYLAKIDYGSLTKPFLAPKAFVFPIVWTIIYLIFYLTMIKIEDKNTYILYIIILCSHIIWNFTFFFLGSYLVGFIVLLIIYLLSFVFVYYISKANKKLSYINVPYLIWLLIALYLNFGVMLLN